MRMRPRMTWRHVGQVSVMIVAVTALSVPTAVAIDTARTLAQSAVTEQDPAYLRGYRQGYALNQPVQMDLKGCELAGSVGRSSSFSAGWSDGCVDAWAAYVKG